MSKRDEPNSSKTRAIKGLRSPKMHTPSARGGRDGRWLEIPPSADRPSVGGAILLTDAAEKLGLALHALRQTLVNLQIVPIKRIGSKYSPKDDAISFSDFLLLKTVVQHLKPTPMPPRLSLEKLIPRPPVSSKSPSTRVGQASPKEAASDEDRRRMSIPVRVFVSPAGTQRQKQILRRAVERLVNSLGFDFVPSN